jgi:hypothetical protein
MNSRRLARKDEVNGLFDDQWSIVNAGAVTIPMSKSAQFKKIAVRPLASAMRVLRLTMPWKCPLCRLPIHHSDAETDPRPNVIYCCHICRLELVIDNHTRTMVAATFVTDDRTSRPPPVRRKRRR